MPYVTVERQHELENGAAPANAGDLTYQITMLIQDYLAANGVRYQHLAEVLGALRGAELDLERRIITPYEQMKQEDNGDVWYPTLLRAAHGPK